jgi:hypothetical protein
MCSEIEAGGYGSEKCSACGGMGFRALEEKELREHAEKIRCSENPMKQRDLRQRLSKKSECPRCYGTGYVPEKARVTEPDSVWTTIRCNKCRGHSRVPYPRRYTWLTLDVVHRLMDWAEIDECGECGANGYLVPITVRDTGSSRKGRMPRGATDTTDDSTVASVATEAFDPADWIGVNPESFERLEDADPVSAAVLGAYHGPDGDRFALHRWGRAFAVWPMTRAGKMLYESEAASSAARSGYLVREIDLLTNARNDEETARLPNHRRRALITAADRQARSLVLAAQRVAEAVAA